MSAAPAIHAGDKVSVAGIPGVHTVLELAEALMPAHAFCRIRLGPGTNYGRWHAGDTLGVEAWRCSLANPGADA